MVVVVVVAVTSVDVDEDVRYNLRNAPLQFSAGFVRDVVVSHHCIRVN